MVNNFTQERRTINVDDTRFIFRTNFAGDPEKDRFGDSRRKACLIIPDIEQAKDIMKMGFKVSQTKPRQNDDPDNFQPEYYVTILLQYRKRNGEPVKYAPKVYLVQEDGSKVQLDEETAAMIDDIRVKNVNVVLSERVYGPGENDRNLYVRTMYVEQRMDDDPYAARYASPADSAEDCDEFPEVPEDDF